MLVTYIKKYLIFVNLQLYIDQKEQSPNNFTFDVEK